MFAEMLCKLTSNVKPITTKRPSLQSSKKQNNYMSHSRKQIIKGAKSCLRNFLTVLKRCYLIIIICYWQKTGTNRTQVLHRIQIRQLTPRQPKLDIRITPQEWKPDLERSLEHDYLFARACECEYEKSIFDAESNNATPPNSPENPVFSDSTTEET